jgi:hypothetical protein
MSSATVRTALMALAIVSFVLAMPSFGKSPKAYGRELVGEFELPVDAVAQYAARLGAVTPNGRPAWDGQAMWVGPLQAAGIGRNPYTQVLTVSGRARAAGDVRTHWHAGWEVRETPVATREMLLPLAALSSGSVAAGAPLTLTAVGGPVSFRGERQAAPMLNLVRAHNLDIDSVRLQVWSGSAPLAWPSPDVTRPGWLLFAVLCALAGWWLTRRPATERGQTPVTRMSNGRAPVRDDSALPPLESLLDYGPPSSLPAPDSTQSPLPDNRAAVAPAWVAAASVPVPAAVAHPPPETTTVASQVARVMGSLRDVMTNGLVMATEFDPRPRRRRRRA